MGCNCCKDVYTKYPHLEPWRDEFEALRLKKSDVESLYKVFTRIDTDGSGTIQVEELLDYLDVDRNKFTQRVFSIFDEDGSKCVDFREFAVALWNYCTLGNATLILFAFDLYDGDSSGIIDASEVDVMLKEIYGDNYAKNVHAHRISAQIGGLSTVTVTKEVFGEFIRKHPALVFPAFEIQRKIIKLCRGKRFWKNVAKRRVELSKGKFLSVGEIIKLLHNVSMQKKLEQTDGEIDFEKLFDGKEKKKGGKYRGKRKNDGDGEINAAAAKKLDVMVNSIGPHSRRRGSGSNPGTVVPTDGTVAQWGTVKNMQGAAQVVTAAGKLKQQRSRRSTFPQAWEEKNMNGGGDKGQSSDAPAGGPTKSQQAANRNKLKGAAHAAASSAHSLTRTGTNSKLKGAAEKSAASSGDVLAGTRQAGGRRRSEVSVDQHFDKMRAESGTKKRRASIA
mmetsp:Transcript_8863/g.13282  ORF Transcript_8863/g.13282 Transcript_8863/m.13282 type:complete len:447 (+) Transcript_8863:128-1468(+)|eukprot:CAMPEP_0185040640 /NCGR_PEP_ID=MMETSP1103-20130426/38915_1 /TAXON_ID=36769 /ORGANISM="Paraphysomonas bandaiensis, Strain Caron Lab Isolate" /LENGTH=446 /DNA_ID=CAMNT_0027580019 /DNA_START=65 /DNA_END=1405 /DNA_ORIENTATION=-